MVSVPGKRAQAPPWPAGLKPCHASVESTGRTPDRAEFLPPIVGSVRNTATIGKPEAPGHRYRSFARTSVVAASMAVARTSAIVVNSASVVTKGGPSRTESPSMPLALPLPW